MSRTADDTSTPRRSRDPAPSIRLAHSDLEIDACFPVLYELRTQLTRSAFVARVREQQRHGYRLAYLETDAGPVAVAGFRIAENLAWGRFLYVDDLVTLASERSHGHGAALLRWLSDQARSAGCAAVHLDSGFQRTGAHRFYEREGMSQTGFHFCQELPLAQRDPA